MEEPSDVEATEEYVGGEWGEFGLSGSRRKRSRLVSSSELARLPRSLHCELLRAEEGQLL